MSEFEKLKERAIKLGLRVENMSELQMIAYLLMIYERMSDSTMSEYG